jgi:hypothetical protein
VENPADLRELQIQSVKKLLNKTDKADAQLSRGQKKRLKKKERFLNSKLIEQKGKETEEIHRAKLQALRDAERATTAKMTAASVVEEVAMLDEQTFNPSVKQEKKKKPEIGDFTGLSSILDSI